MKEDSIFQVQGLSMDFGGLRAVDNLTFAIRPREIVALIGPNGAGKTTCFNCITGMYTPSAGEIVLFSPDRLEKRRLTGAKPNQITEWGLARTFQNIRLFANMTVLENVMVGRHCRSSAGILGAILRNTATLKEEQSIVGESYRILKLVGLDSHVNEIAKNLPYGAQRRLEIARALATAPVLLLLDEPAAGMNPKETQELDRLITLIRDQEKIAILLIEHDMRLVMSISDRIIVMDYGKKIAEGVPEETKCNPVVIKAYLGEDIHAAQG